MRPRWHGLSPMGQARFMRTKAQARESHAAIARHPCIDQTTMAHPLALLPLPEVLDDSKLACPEGLEPPTPSLEGWCSIQLSYGQPDCDPSLRGAMQHQCAVRCLSIT